MLTQNIYRFHRVQLKLWELRWLRFLLWFHLKNLWYGRDWRRNQLRGKKVTFGCFLLELIQKWACRLEPYRRWFLLNLDMLRVPIDLRSFWSSKARCIWNCWKLILVLEIFIRNFTLLARVFLLVYCFSRSCQCLFSFSTKAEDYHTTCRRCNRYWWVKHPLLWLLCCSQLEFSQPLLPKN